MKRKVVMLCPDSNHDAEWHWMPANFVFLAATLVDRGYEPVVVDERVLGRERTIKKVESYLNDAVIALIYTASGSQLRNARFFAKHIKENSSVPICVGGSHPSALPEITMTDSNFDFTIVGQGEYAVCDLCDVICKNESHNKLACYDGIPHLMFRDEGGKALRSRARFRKIRINDLPPLPYFNKNVIDVEDYLSPTTKAINYSTSTGCVGRCTFCYWHDEYRYSCFSPERVISDLKRFKEDLQVRNITFDDPTYFVNPHRVVELSKLMIEEDLQVKWRGNGRVDTLKKLSDKDLEIIRDSGCHVIHIGLESGSNRILKLMNKGIRSEDSLRLMELSKQSGIRFRFHIIMGVPSETLDDLKQTAKLLNNMIERYPDFDYTINFFTPYPGNYLTALAGEYGYRAPQTLDECERINPAKYVPVTVNDRIVYKELSPWKYYIELPWFSKEFNRKYMDCFRELIPEKGTVETTDGRIDDVYKHGYDKYLESTRSRLD